MRQEYRLSRLSPDTAILLVALIGRLAVLALAVVSGALLSDPLESRVFHGGDSEQYTRLAQNIVEHGVFSLNATAPFTPDLIRTPGYPVFLASLYLLAGHRHDPVLIVTAQLLLSLLNVWFILKIGRKLFTPTTARLAGLLYAVAPATLVFGGLVMSETLFATLLLLSILLLINITEEQGWGPWGCAAASGVAFALGVYTRPIGLYAVPILMLALVIRLGWNRRALGLSAAVLAAYAVSLAPWYYRNYVHYNALIFTSIANQNLLIYNVGSIEAHRQGISWDVAKDRLWLEYQSRLDELDLENPNQAQISAIMGEIALQHILADPASAIVYQSADLLNAFRPGYSMAMLLLRDSAETFGGEVQVGNLEVIADAAPHEYLVFGLMTVYYAVVYLGVIIGGATLIWRRQWYTLVICGLITFWFVYQPGIAGNARFRAPIEGLLALLAAVGLLWIRAHAARLRPGGQVQRIT